MSQTDEYYRDILKKSFTNPKTLDSYETRLRTIKEKVGAPSYHSVLTEPNSYYPKLKEAYPSLTTRKNLITVLLSLYREDKALKEAYTPAYEIWKKLHEDLSRLQEAKIRRSEPDAKQVEKYTSFEEIQGKYDELRRRGPHTSERASMQYVLLSIFVHLRPKRADLGAIRIYHEKDPRMTDMNYIVLRKKGSSYLVMNLYKTSKYYQTVEEDLPEGLLRDIETSLGRWPRDYLFRKDDGEPMSNNTYSVFVKNTFEHFFGRATGVSLLRHIYITEKLDFDNMTLEEQDREAKLMLHTAGLQRQYKWPKKTICPKLCAAYIKPTSRTRKIKRRTKNAVQTHE
jgi:hypothetical protein